MKKERLFIVCLCGTYGGQWYCAVYASSEEEAVKKGKNKYNMNKKTQKNFGEFINITTNINVETELIFDENNISNVWYVCW